MPLSLYTYIPWEKFHRSLLEGDETVGHLLLQKDFGDPVGGASRDPGVGRVGIHYYMYVTVAFIKCHFSFQRIGFSR